MALGNQHLSLSCLVLDVRDQARDRCVTVGFGNGEC